MCSNNHHGVAGVRHDSIVAGLIDMNKCSHENTLGLKIVQSVKYYYIPSCKSFPKWTTIWHIAMRDDDEFF